MSSTHSSTNLLFSTLEDNSSASCCCLSCSCSFVARAFQIVTAQNCTAFMQKLSFQRSNETRNDKARSLYLMAANLKPTSLPTSKRSEDCLSHPCLTHCPQRKNNLRRYPQQQEQYVGNRIHLVFHLRPYPEFSGKVRQLYLALSLEPSLRTFPLPPRTFVGLFPQTYS